jgi:hypothetical protein
MLIMVWGMVHRFHHLWHSLRLKLVEKRLILRPDQVQTVKMFWSHIHQNAVRINCQLNLLRAIKANGPISGNCVCILWEGIQWQVINGMRFEWPLKGQVF